MKKKKIDVSHVTDAYKANKFDPNGSYLGITNTPDDELVQDADDL